MATGDPLLAPIEGAERHEVGGVKIDAVRVGDGRVKRTIYPAGFRWSQRMRDVVGTELCEHAHIGVLVRGRIGGEYADGCTFAWEAPAAILIEPGHDAWVDGDEDAVIIQVDFEGETVERFGLRERHAH